MISGLVSELDVLCKLHQHGDSLLEISLAPMQVESEEASKIANGYLLVDVHLV